MSTQNRVTLVLIKQLRAVFYMVRWSMGPEQVCESSGFYGKFQGWRPILTRSGQRVKQGPDVLLNAGAVAGAADVAVVRKGKNRPVPIYAAMMLITKKEIRFRQNGKN